MKILYIPLVSLYLLCSPLNAQAVTSAQLDAAEDLLEKEMKSQNVSNSKRSNIYITAARDLMLLKKYKKAEKLYKKVVALKQNDKNKNEAYNNLLVIAQHKGKKETKEIFKEAKKYWNLKKDKPSKTLLAFWEESINGSPDTLKKYKGPNKEFMVRRSIPELIKDKKYSDALQYLEKRSIEQGPMINKVLVDLLRTVSHQSGKKLYCKKHFQKDPTSNYFAILVCKALINFKSGSKLSQNDLNVIEKRIKRSDSKRLFWVEVLKDLL